MRANLINTVAHAALSALIVVGTAVPLRAADALTATAAADTPYLTSLYTHLHSNPELSFQEERTAGIVADFLTEWGFEVTTGVGGTGVIGILRNGEGGTALRREDRSNRPGDARLRPRHARHLATRCQLEAR